MKLTCPVGRCENEPTDMLSVGDVPQTVICPEHRRAVEREPKKWTLSRSLSEPTRLEYDPWR